MKDAHYWVGWLAQSLQEVTKADSLSEAKDEAREALDAFSRASMPLCDDLRAQCKQAAKRTGGRRRDRHH